MWTAKNKHKVAKQIPKKVEPNNIYSPEGSIPFKRYFHGTQIKIKSSQNQKKETKKNPKKRQANIKWTHAFKKKRKKEDEEEGLIFRTSES